MFADDNQLFDKNDESIKICFDILTICQKASGSNVNLEKKKGIYIGSAKNNRPMFAKIVWTKDNVKTLGIHHGYNIQNEEIWKSIIDKMNNYVHVWISRNLTYAGKTLIMKNLLISFCGYEIETRRIQEKYVKEKTTLI